jgi:HNH endonuclease
MMRASKERLMKNVSVSSDCWVWMGATSSSGYGTMEVSGKTASVHRVSYELFKGEIPAGMVIDHICKNRICVNPDHLRVVTHKQNTLENSNASAAINAKKTHCVNGHPLEGDNLIVKKGKNGNETRACRTCARHWWRENWRKKSRNLLKGSQS